MPQRLLRNSTVKVAELLQKALTELVSLRKGVVTADFILMALIEQKDSIALKIWDEMRLDSNEIRRKIVDQILEASSEIPGMHLDGVSTQMKVSQEVQILFEAADQEREKLHDSYISTAAVYLAFFDANLSKVNSLLEEHGITYEDSWQALIRMRGNVKITNKEAESRVSFLDEYTTDITALARKGQLDPVVGREKEIKRVIEILSRRKKNNPVLIGEPGVGKTVIVDGLAQQIVNGDVPEYLYNKRVLSLEIGTLIAGAKMQGEFEERIKSIKDEVIAAAGEIILFIDELHTVVGAGRSGGALDASNMLKPALAKGLLQCIGATTLKEYKQFIEPDKALERRFQLVKVDTPSVEETVQILHGLKARYQSYHQIEYSDAAIEAAASLSEKYIQQRFLPDKAIDLMDEAGAAKRIKKIYLPPEIRHLENEKRAIEAKKLKAFSVQNFEQMAKYQMEISLLDDQLDKLRKANSKKAGEADHIVSDQDIAQIVSNMTGIPAQRMVAAEANKLMGLEQSLQKRVIGQQHALHAVTNAIKRNRSGLRSPNKPIASFLFLGPTGVGKTELAKALAEQILDDESKIIRLDMSEYMERHNVSKLIGSPPGYVGYGEGGQLTEKVKRQPYSIILLDEFEKAHPDVYNVLLPVLDEGFLTDAEGEKVSFRNCLIIGTSNIGSHILSERKAPVGIGAQAHTLDQAEEHAEVLKELKKYLRPEFLNRLDEVIIFNRLGQAELAQIITLYIDDLRKRLSDLGLKLQVDPKVPQLVLGSLHNLHYGARPLKRQMEVLIENKVATILIEQASKNKGEIIVAATAKGEIDVKWAD